MSSSSIRTSPLSPLSPSSFDCSQLISLCTQLEDDAFHFGHPPAPQLEMVQFDDTASTSSTSTASTSSTVSILVGRTVHGVCAHVIVAGDASNTKPTVLLRLKKKKTTTTYERADQEEEEITALQLVHPIRSSNSNSSNNNSSNNNSSNDDSRNNNSGSTTPQQQQQQQQQQQHQQQRNKRNNKRNNKHKKKKDLIVCVGTSASRFFCIQLTVAANGFKTSAPWQPFPLHTSGLFSKSSSSSRSSNYDGCGVRSIVVTWNDESIATTAIATTTTITAAIASSTYVWISYGDGTLLRVAAHALIKPDKENNNGDDNKHEHNDSNNNNSNNNNKESSHTPNISSCLKVQTLLPNHDSSTHYTVIPCQACPSHWIHDDVPGSFSALVYPNNHAHNATTAATATGLGEEPTLVVYASRNATLPQHPQLRRQTSFNTTPATTTSNNANNTNPAFPHDDTHYHHDNMRKDGDSELLTVAIGATSALMRGVSGVMKWGWKQGTPKNKVVARPRNDLDANNSDDDDDDGDDDDSTIYFPQAYQPATVQLTATCEVHDAPRHLQHVQVIHGATAAAAVMTDTLGRVQWMELDQHFSITKLWKGHRDATCVPIIRTTTNNNHHQSNDGNDGNDDNDDNDNNNNTALVIYSGQRKSIEVWQIHPQQHRLFSRQLGRDAQVVPCTTYQEQQQQQQHHEEGSIAKTSCFLLESDGKGRATILNELVVDTASSSAVAPGSPSASVASAATATTTTTTTTTQQRYPNDASSSCSIVTSSPHHDAKLRMLQQLLSNTNVPHTQADVFQIVSKISNLQHLCQALDLLAVTPAHGSAFATDCLQHCRGVHQKATQGQTADVTQSPPVLELEGKIQLHTQLIAAFDALHAFELRVSNEQQRGGNDNDDDDDDTRSQPKSAWAIEGMAWLHTSDTIAHGHDADKHMAMMHAADAASCNDQPITFSRFCQCCNIAGSTTTTTQDNTGNNSNKYNVLLSDSSRTRKEFLSHLFAPLLKDAFNYKVVSNVVDELGFQDLAVQQYLGEWFMTVSAAQAAHKTFFALYSPISRWIRDLVSTKVDALMEAGQPLPHILLSELHTFCSESDDLVRAFLLAAACRECISTVVTKREAKTYGAVWKSQAVQPWDELLRKIRVSLLLYLRLYGIPLGPFPITVKHVEDGSIFSIYELVARDEIACSHKHDEIIALEHACKGSGMVFDPSSSLGDDPSRWRVLQKACLASSISEAERAEYLVELETEVQGALLLYLSHYNNPPLLCAHRALLLAQQWIEAPKRIELLRDCLDALAALSEDTAYAGAIRLEIWQTCIRPVFRAFLFGFDDVQEIQEDVYSPLMLNVDWMVRMGKAGLSILSLIEKSVSTKTVSKDEALSESPSGWPPLATDAVLQSLVHKFRPVDQNALDVHRVIVSGCMVSSDVHTLSECVEGFYDAFVSLYQPSGPPSGDSEKQLDFLEQAIISRAENLHKPMLDRFDLDEIETLALLWSIDVRDVRTIFLLAMYEFGKDAVVDDLLTRMSSQRGMDLTRFLEDGIGIVCRRLHQMLHVKRGPEIRSLLGLLDADTTEWIRDQAEGTFSLLEDDTGADRVVLDVPLQSTHYFVLRLMSIAMSHADKDTRVKLHSLSILTGTLVKELEKQQPV